MKWLLLTSLVPRPFSGTDCQKTWHLGVLSILQCLLWCRAQCHEVVFPLVLIKGTSTNTGKKYKHHGSIIGMVILLSGKCSASDIRIGPPFAFQTGSGLGDGQHELKKVGHGLLKLPTVALVLGSGWKK